MGLTVKSITITLTALNITKKACLPVTSITLKVRLKTGVMIQKGPQRTTKKVTRSITVRNIMVRNTTGRSIMTRRPMERTTSISESAYC